MSEDDYGFVIDLNAGALVFEGGFSAPIVGMIDKFGDDTENTDEAVVLKILMPPDRLVIVLDLRDIKTDDDIVMH